jgi:hypothetical protein
VHNGHKVGATEDGPWDELPPVGELRHVEGLRRFPGEPPFVIGTPDDALEILLPVRDGERRRATQLVAICRLPGMGSSEVRRSTRLFAEHCMPELQAART